MTLVDASRKKINFVRHALRLLDVSDVSAIQVRAEEMGQNPLHQNRFGVIVCRAFADLDTIARLTAPLLSEHGKVYVYQGPASLAHPAGSGKSTQSSSYHVAASHAYVLPILGDRRILTVIVPTGRCSA
jgi:16S rRNA G527 N7-methylase RsmG